MKIFGERVKECLKEYHAKSICARIKRTTVHFVRMAKRPQ